MCTWCFAVCENILSMRRKVLETSAGILVCEIRPLVRKMIVAIDFYSPPDFNIHYIKEFKKSLQLIQGLIKLLSLGTSIFQISTGSPGRQSLFGNSKRFRSLPDGVFSNSRREHARLILIF